jgi:predicted transcriptional regulator of viral defense system
MRFEELLTEVADEPVFETGLLLAGNRDPDDVRRQLSRWVEAGRIHQLRRGLYALAPPFAKVRPHPFLVANRIQPGSYVSLQAALSHYGLIPEYVPVVTSVGPGRPQRLETALGAFDFRHVQQELVCRYRWLEVDRRQRAFVAAPEKALLDLVYLEPGADRPDYLRELRLQNVEILDADELERIARDLGKPKLRRAAKRLTTLIESELTAYEAL